jgi:hypothetical protein
VPDGQAGKTALLDRSTTAYSGDNEAGYRPDIEQPAVVKMTGRNNIPKKNNLGISELEEILKMTEEELKKENHEPPQP